MPQVRPETLDDVAQALQRYTDEIESTNATVSTKSTYVYHARLFVRWLADDFKPGAGKQQARRRQ